MRLFASNPRRSGRCLRLTAHFFDDSFAATEICCLEIRQDAFDINEAAPASLQQGAQSARNSAGSTWSQ
jgi:hypothetical protein